MKFSLFWIGFFLILGLSACKLDSERKKGKKPITIDFEYPISELQFPIDIKLNGLSKALNIAIPDALVDTKMPIGNNTDSLQLTIVRKGKIFFESKGSTLNTNIPLEVSAIVTKKVLGFSIGNKKPIDFSLILEISSELRLTDDWQLAATCSIKKIRWMKKPTIKLLIANIFLDKFVEDQLENNKEKIESMICQQLSKAVNIRQEVSKVWEIMNVPQRVVKDPIELYFHSAPSYFAAAFEHNIQDTIRINILTRSRLSVSTSRKTLFGNSNNELPSNSRRINNKNAIVANPVFVLPLKTLDKFLNEKVAGLSYSYSNLEVKINSVKTSIEDDQLMISIKVQGDVEAEILARGVPVLNKEKTLSISNFQYEIISDNMLLSATDWLTNDSFKEYILEKANVPLKSVLESIDVKIEKALNQSKTGDVLGLKLQLEFLDKEKLILMEDQLVWMFYLKGQAKMSLKLDQVK
jgi:hypothetical protein